ncbi:hypothetical protein [Planifilum fimeticola]
MAKKQKQQEFIIEEIPGEECLGKLLAEVIVDYINEKYGRKVVKLKEGVKCNCCGKKGG